MIWHSESSDRLLQSLDVSRQAGLTSAQVSARLRRYGANIPPAQHTHRFGACLGASFKNPGVALSLAVAIAVIGFAIYSTTHGTPTSAGLAIAMLVLVLAYALAVAFIRYRAEKKLAAIRHSAKPTTRVLREGKWYAATAERLVPGDIIRLREGDLIPADCRVLEAYSLLCDESALTGESVPASKAASEELDPITTLAKRVNMLYAGCTVSLGSAEAVVVETGDRTEICKQQTLKPVDRHELPRQKPLTRFGRTVTLVSAVLCLLALALSIVCLQQYQDLTWQEILLAFGALVIAASTPWLDLSALLALGATAARLDRREVSVQRLPAIETAGQASVIILDRMSILTENHFTVTEIYTGDRIRPVPTKNIDHPALALAQLSTLCTRDPSMRDPLDLALMQHAAAIHMEREKLINEFPQLGEIPSAAGRRRMTSIHLISGKNVAILKGDPAEVLPHCIGMDEGMVTSVAQSMEQRGLRVLAVGYRYVDEISTHPVAEEIETDMIFVGLIGLKDQPRDAAEEALLDCQEAGIRPVLVTADSLAVATAEAIEVGLIDDGSQVLDGAQLADLSDNQLADVLYRYRVISRPTPADKLRLVKAWKATGATVLVTGDDARDCAAMKAGDVSVAIGDCTDVARACADLVIPDGHLDTLTAAIREGRGALSSARKSMGFRLAASLGLLLAQLLGLLFGGVLLFSPLMLTVMAILIDLFFVPALAAEKSENREMRRYPQPASGFVFPASWVLRTGLQGVLIATGAVLTYVLAAVSTGHWTGAAVSQAAAAGFLILVIEGLASRSLGAVIGARGNLRLLVILLLTVGLSVAALTIAPLGTVFGVADLTFTSTEIILPVALALLVLTEIFKELAYGLGGGHRVPR